MKGPKGLLIVDVLSTNSLVHSSFLFFHCVALRLYEEALSSFYDQVRGAYSRARHLEASSHH
eukprot:scaffold314972_cov56-Attheya_sp.AAC.2